MSLNCPFCNPKGTVPEDLIRMTPIISGNTEGVKYEYKCYKCSYSEIFNEPIQETS